jgi:superfamily I DNA/RNA helicase
VAALDTVAHEVVAGRHGPLRFPTEAEYRTVWTAAAARTGGAFSPYLLRREWENVVFGQGIRDLAGYLAADRRGQGRRLSTVQRQDVWRALQEATRTLRATGIWTPLTVAQEATRLLATRPPFAHIVADEVQDLHPVHWRLLRAAVPEGPDDLFLTGDPHQRISGHRATLGAAGISVAGRSTRLTLNHRTTAEILDWAMAVLADPDSDDLDSGFESMAGYRAARLTGTPPELVGYPSHQEECDGLVGAVRGWLAEGVPPSSIGVAARTPRIARTIADALGPASDVFVGTLHAVKGLEFRRVALVGINRGVVPDPQAITAEDDDPVGHALDLQQERSLLFVAATRAREHLRVSWSGTPSPLLP